MIAKRDRIVLTVYAVLMIVWAVGVVVFFTHDYLTWPSWMKAKRARADFEPMYKDFASGGKSWSRELHLAVSRLPIPLREGQEEQVLDLALNHPYHLVRYVAGGKFAVSRTGNNELLPFDDEVEALIESERRVQLEQIVVLLEQGDFNSARKRLSMVVYTLEDSWDHENKMLAIRAVGLYATEEDKRGILASSKESVFAAVLEEGLIKDSWVGSWSSSMQIMKNVDVPPDIGVEVEALAEALCKFGPEAAAHTVTRLEEAVVKTKETGRWQICSEEAQVIAVLELLGSHAVEVVPRLVEILEPDYDKPNDLSEFWVVRAVEETVQYDPQRVRKIIEASGLDRKDYPYKSISRELEKYAM